MPDSPTFVVDLRSDTVTRPTAAMRAVMAAAEVGDDVLGDDPTVLKLQERIAGIMGKEAACFVPSGSMANQTAIRAHTEPGDEVIAHRDSHIIHYETGAPAALSGCMIRPLDGEAGLFEAADVEAAVRPNNPHSPRSKLLVVENTHNRGGGSVWSVEQVARVCERGRANGLRLHLDGARVWNACAATGNTPAEYARHFDTVSCCFSKGLGAPVGSAVCGDRATIIRVHRFRKMFGGAMRQAGILAAAALYALENHRERLVEDHRNARRLAEGLGAIKGVTIPLPVETNMVFFDLGPGLGAAAEVCEKLKSRGVLMLATATRRVRAVCHLDIESGMIERAVAEVAEVCAERSVVLAA
jgi:threonine aldolase